MFKELKYEKKIINLVHYGELEKFIENYFRLNHDYDEELEFSIIDLEVCQNDSYISKYIVSGKLSRQEQSEIDTMIANKTYDTYSIGLILKYLCSKEAVDPGYYFIHVCW